MILIKRAVPLLLALVVIFAVAVPAFAVDYTVILPLSTLSLDFSPESGWSQCDFSTSVDSFFLTSLIDSGDPLNVVVDGVPFSIAGYFDEDSFWFTGESVLVVFSPDNEEFIFGISGDLKSVQVEIYAGSKPADPTENTTSLLFDLGSVAGAVMQFVSTVADTIASTPLLLLTVGFFFGGGCVGIFGRILSKN